MNLDELYDDNAGRSSKISIPTHNVSKPNMVDDSADDYWGDLSGGKPKKKTSHKEKCGLLSPLVD